jgi:hypothetical protein
MVLREEPEAYSCCSVNNESLMKLCTGHDRAMPLDFNVRAFRINLAIVARAVMINF